MMFVMFVLLPIADDDDGGGVDVDDEVDNETRHRCVLTPPS